MDSIILAVFGTITVLGFAFGAFCTWMAVRIARSNKKDSDIMMALWSMGSVAGLSVGAMSFAYFVWPIIWDRL